MEKEKKEKVYVIAPKKAITSKRGVLAEGMVVKEKDFPDSKILPQLLEKGFVIEKGDYNAVRDTLKSATKEDIIPPVTGEDKKPAPKKEAPKK